MNTLARENWSSGIMVLSVEEETEEGWVESAALGTVDKSWEWRREVVPRARPTGWRRMKRAVLGAGRVRLRWWEGGGWRERTQWRLLIRRKNVGSELSMLPLAIGAARIAIFKGFGCSETQNNRHFDFNFSISEKRREERVTNSLLNRQIFSLRVSFSSLSFKN